MADQQIRVSMVFEGDFDSATCTFRFLLARTLTGVFTAKAAVGYRGGEAKRIT